MPATAYRTGFRALALCDEDETACIVDVLAGRAVIKHGLAFESPHKVKSCYTAVGDSTLRIVNLRILYK